MWKKISGIPPESMKNMKPGCRKPGTPSPPATNEARPFTAPSQKVFPEYSQGFQDKPVKAPISLKFASLHLTLRTIAGTSIKIAVQSHISGGGCLQLENGRYGEG
jgi:hypothetical protein